MSTMIDAKGWRAAFKTEYGQITEPLLFWVSEDGTPVGYILSNRTGCPRSAESVGNFGGYVQDEEIDAVTVPAEPGWWIVNRAINDPDRAYWAKVLAWRIFNDGYGVKAIGTPCADGSSMPEEASEDKIMFVFDPTREPLSDGPWPVIDEVPA